MTAHARQRPRRQRKSDRLLNPGATANEIRADHIVAPFDRLARKMDRKWGIEVLPGLVSVETAGKYGSAIAKLNAALDSGDTDEIQKRAQVCMRGLAAMDREAEEAGQPHSDPHVWEVEVEGQKFGVIEDVEHWQAAQDKRPDLRIFTMREVAVALRSANNEVVDAVKHAFPGAEVSAVRKEKLPEEFWKSGGDEVPF